MKKKRQKANAERVRMEMLTEKPVLKKIPRWLIGLVIILVIGTVISAYFFEKKTPNEAKKRQLGGVIGCQQIPPFVRALGFGANAAFSTSDRHIHGLVLIEGQRTYQHPTWKLAGRLAPITRDDKGNAFVAPAPWIDVLRNKPEEQNKLFRVDSQTQIMKEFCDLPKAAPPSSQNPYGVLGLTYDCDTNSLYASSIAGSTRNEVKGRIFQLNKEGEILSQLENFDVIGLAVFNLASGKRLYFGQARTPEIWSIALDENGNFSGEARKEVTLENLGPRGDDKARRISFTQNEMTVYGIEFSFNLIAPTERQQTIYRFYFNAAKEAWSYIEEPPQIVS